MEQVRKDPQVRKIMTLFGGEVVDVRRDLISEEPDEDNLEGQALNED